MAKFVPLEKQSKKSRKAAARLKRRFWTSDPRTKVVESKKLYDRVRLAHDRSNDNGMSVFYMPFERAACMGLISSAPFVRYEKS